MSSKIEIERERLVSILRDLESIVPSLDRLGSAAVWMTGHEANQALADFFDEWDVGRKLARIRSELSDALGPLSDEQIESIFGDVRVWRPNECLDRGNPAEARPDKRREGQSE
jgi:hypothetical protein